MIAYKGTKRMGEDCVKNHPDEKNHAQNKKQLDYLSYFFFCEINARNHIVKHKPFDHHETSFSHDQQTGRIQQAG